MASSPGDVILLAPAAASFDQYDNFEARGEDFMAQVVLLAPAAASFDQYDSFEARGEDFMAQVAGLVEG